MNVSDGSSSGRFGVSQADFSDSLSQRLLAPLSRPVPDAGLSLSYRICATVSAAAMILVVCCYALLMLGMVWFTMEYLIAHAYLAFSGQAHSVGVYIFLGILATLLVLLLIKPAFHIGQRGLDPIDLTPEHQPLLWRYVEQLAKALDAPMPQRIGVVPEATAAASLRGILSCFRSPRLDLVLGLTLVAGMDVRELTAVLAHEIKHFAQHRSWRLLSVIRAINLWFAVAIFERDRFDLFLQRASAVPVIGWPLLLARLVMWLGRIVLWIFMMLGHLASSLISRASEYHSDRGAARIAGSRPSSQALARTVVLSLAEEAMLEEVGASWQEKRLPDDLPQIIVHRANRIETEQRDQILKFHQSLPTRWLDTHPSLGDRIRALKEIDLPGVIDCDEPARVLVKDFSGLCQKASMGFYRAVLKEDLDKAQIVPAEVISQEQTQLDEAHKSLRRYYQGEMAVVRPIFPDAEASTALDNVSAAAEALLAARNEMFSRQAQLQDVLGKFIECRNEAYGLYEMRSLLSAGLPLKDDHGRPIRSNQIGQEYTRVQDKQAQLEEQLRELEALAQRRLTLGIRLWQAGQNSPQAPGVVVWPIDRLLACSATIEGLNTTLDQLSWETRVLMVLLQVMQQGRGNKTMRKYMDKSVAQIQQKLRSVQEEFRKIAYPFKHAKPDATLADYAFDQPVQTQEEDALKTVVVSQDMLQRIDMLVLRVLADLACKAENAETAIGLSAQSEPPPHLPQMPVVPPGRRDSARQAQPVQAILAAAAVFIVVLVSAAAIHGGPKFALLPKHAEYKPVTMSASWTPPPRADVWHMGFRAYEPSTYNNSMLTAESMNRRIDPYGPQRSDPWGRPPEVVRAIRTPSASSSGDGTLNRPGYPGYRPNVNRPGFGTGYRPGKTPGIRTPRTPGYNPSPSPGYTPPVYTPPVYTPLAPPPPPR